MFHLYSVYQIQVFFLHYKKINQTAYFYICSAHGMAVRLHISSFV